MNIIIQARMNSTRLPSKVLLKINGVSIIDYLIKRIKHSNYKNRIVVATSIEKSDYPIQQFCETRNIDFFRGDLNNVTKRYAELIKKYNFNSFLRICGDSPMIDPRIIDNAIKVFKNGKYDLVTNKFPRSYPIGQTVEILNAKKFLETLHLVKTNNEKENVTEHYYNNKHLYKIKNFKIKKNISLLNLAIDNKKNFTQFKLLLEKYNFDLKNLPFQKIVKEYNGF